MTRMGKSENPPGQPMRQIFKNLCNPWMPFLHSERGVHRRMDRQVATRNLALRPLFLSFPICGICVICGSRIGSSSKDRDNGI